MKFVNLSIEFESTISIPMHLNDEVNTSNDDQLSKSQRIFPCKKLNQINSLNLLSFFSFAIFDGNFIENLINFPDTHRNIFVTTIFENIICNFSKITSFLCSSIFLYTKIQSKSKINFEISQKTNPNIFIQFLSIVTFFRNT